MLKKDYKQYQAGQFKWSMSSVNFCIHEWLDKDKVKHLDEIDAFMKENEVRFFAMLSCYKIDSNTFRRDLALFASSDLMKCFSKFVNDNAINHINIDKSESDKIQYAIYDVKDVCFTRKYWQPALDKFIKENQL